MKKFAYFFAGIFQTSIIHAINPASFLEAPVILTILGTIVTLILADLLLDD